MLGQLSLVLIVVASALSAGIAGTVAWQYQAHKYEAEKAELYASAQAALRQQEKRYADQFRKATDAAQARTSSLRMDAARARDAAQRMRDALAAATASARDTPATCPERVTAYDDVLRSMEAEGRKLAEVCDRHANDLRTLIEAWPR